MKNSFATVEFHGMVWAQVFELLFLYGSEKHGRSVFPELKSLTEHHYKNT